MIWILRGDLDLMHDIPWPMKLLDWFSGAINLERQTAAVEREIMWTVWSICILSIGLCLLGAGLWQTSRRASRDHLEPTGIRER